MTSIIGLEHTLGNGKLNCANNEGFEPAPHGLYLVDTVPENGFLISVKICEYGNATYPPSSQGAVILYLIRSTYVEDEFVLKNSQLLSFNNSRHPKKGDSIAVYVANNSFYNNKNRNITYHPLQIAIKKNSSKRQYSFWTGSDSINEENLTDNKLKNRVSNKIINGKQPEWTRMDVELNEGGEIGTSPLHTRRLLAPSQVDFHSLICPLNCELALFNSVTCVCWKQRGGNVGV